MIALIYFEVMHSTDISKENEHVSIPQMSKVFRIKAVIIPTFVPFSAKQSSMIQVDVVFDFIRFDYYPE